MQGNIPNQSSVAAGIPINIPTPVSYPSSASVGQDPGVWAFILFLSLFVCLVCSIYIYEHFGLNIFHSKEKDWVWHEGDITIFSILVRNVYLSIMIDWVEIFEHNCLHVCFLEQGAAIVQW